MERTEYTRKALYKGYGKENVIIVRSYDLWERTRPTAYWAGVFGWNCDIVFTRHRAYVFGDRPCGVLFKGTEKELEKQMEEDGAFY